MKNISFMAMFAAFLLTGCKQDAQVKFAGEEGAKVTFSASINEQNAQDVSRVTGVTWDDGDEVIRGKKRCVSKFGRSENI